MRTAVIVATAVLATACSSIKSKTEAGPAALAGVHLIQVEDKTNAVLLRASNADLIADLVDTALRGNGFRTCRSPCEADATATVTVRRYSEQISYSVRRRLAAPSSSIVFDFRITDKDGTTLMETSSGKKSAMPPNDLAALMVQDLAARIPVAK